MGAREPGKAKASPERSGLFQVWIGLRGGGRNEPGRFCILFVSMVSAVRARGLVVYPATWLVRPIIWEATFLKGGRQTGIQQRRNGERRMCKASMVEFGHGHALPYQGLGTPSLQEPLLHRRDGAKARPSIWEASRETVAGRRDSSSLFFYVSEQ